MNYINSNTDKIPVDGNGYKVDITTESNLITYEEACRNRILKGFEVTRVLTGCGVWCLDIDHCIVDGVVSDLAKNLLTLAMPHKVYIETSVSGTGLHIWGNYHGDIPLHNCKNTKLNIELYTDKRAIILGEKIPQSIVDTIEHVGSVEPSNTLFKSLIDTYFGESLKNLINPDEWQTGAEHTGAEMLAMIKKRAPAKVVNPFTGGLSLVGLLKMKKEEWQESDKSSLDMSLLNNLAFHCKKHHEQIELTYRASNIGQYREGEEVNKLDRSAGGNMSYMVRSISQAVADCENVFITDVERVREKIENPVVGLPDSPAGYFLKDFYIIYNGEGVRFYHQPTRREMSKTCFKDAFRIGPYDFELAALDRVLGGKTYHPGESLIVEDMNIKLINEWINPAEPEELSPDDKDLIDSYFNAICPIKTERDHLKKWCAHLVQRPQDKILHAVLLYGFDTGTGKSTLGVMLEKALGDGNTARINNNTLGDQFNGWLTRSTFGWCDEINTSTMSRQKKNAITETIKEWITNRSMPIREMYNSTINAKNWVNGILFTSNDDEALFVDDKDRRLFIIKVLNNMLITTLINGGGFTRLNHTISGGQFVTYFNQIDISDFNPATKAPITTAKEEMIDNTKDPIEQIVIDEIQTNSMLATTDYVFLGKLAEKHDVAPAVIAKQLRKMGYTKYNSGGIRYWYSIPATMTHSEIKRILKLC
ncbi:MAG: hypothetical protein KUG81_05835 [Gammaproteobacteria bacterium]|nr:hypothetical protein [Gammaproteobacteria bacterium]